MEKIFFRLNLNRLENVNKKIYYHKSNLKILKKSISFVMLWAFLFSNAAFAFQDSLEEHHSLRTMAFAEKSDKPELPPSPPDWLIGEGPTALPGALEEKAPLIGFSIGVGFGDEKELINVWFGIIDSEDGCEVVIEPKEGKFIVTDALEEKSWSLKDIKRPIEVEGLKVECKRFEAPLSADVDLSKVEPSIEVVVTDKYGNEAIFTAYLVKKPDGPVRITHDEVFQNRVVRDPALASMEAEIDRHIKDRELTGFLKWFNKMYLTRESRPHFRLLIDEGDDAFLRKIIETFFHELPKRYTPKWQASEAELDEDEATVAIWQRNFERSWQLLGREPAFIPQTPEGLFQYFFEQFVPHEMTRRHLKEYIEATGLSDRPAFLTKIIEAIHEGYHNPWDFHTQALKVAIKMAMGGEHPLLPKPAKVVISDALFVLRGHSKRVTSIDITSDGKKVVTASDDKTVIIWDLDTGKPLHTLFGHTEGVSHAVITPDNKKVITAAGSTAIVWDLDKGKLFHILKGHTKDIYSIAIAPDARKAVTASLDKTAKVWDLDNGKLLRTLKGHQHMVLHVAITPDGKRVVTGSVDKTAKVWDLDTGKLIHSLEGHSDSVDPLAITPDGKKVITASRAKRIFVWDLESGKLLFNFKAPVGLFHHLAITSDSKRLVIEFHNTVRVWDLETGGGRHFIDGHPIPIFDLVITPDGKKIITAGTEKTQIWDLLTGTLVAEIPKGNFTKLAVTPDSKRLVAVFFEGGVFIYDLSKADRPSRAEIGKFIASQI